MITCAEANFTGDDFLYVCVAISTTIAMVAIVVRHCRGAAPRGRRPQEPTRGRTHERTIAKPYRGGRRNYRINEYGEVSDDE